MENKEDNAKYGSPKIQGTENAFQTFLKEKLKPVISEETRPTGEKETRIFMKAMGIVNQMFDYLIEEGIEISVDFRQEHNDTLDDYVFKQMKELVSQARKEVVDDLIRITERSGFDLISLDFLKKIDLSKLKAKE